MHKWEKDIQVILGRWVAKLTLFLFLHSKFPCATFSLEKEIISTFSGQSRLKANIQIHNLTSRGTIKGNSLLVGQNYM